MKVTQKHTKPKKIRATRPSWAGKTSIPIEVSKVITLIVLAVIVLFPMLVVVSTSLSTREELAKNGGFTIIPSEITFDAYHSILSGGIVSRAVIVSTLITIVGTAISLSMTTLAAYALSRPGALFGRGLLTFVLLTFLFHPGMIPVYLMVKELNLIDSYWALILPGAVSAFNLIIIRGFMMNIPGEILDSARVDGASEWKIFFRIALPLSKAVVAVVGLFYAVGYWNAFFNAMLYLNDPQKWPLQLVLRTYVLQGSPLNVDPTGTSLPPPEASVQMAVVVIAIIPILCMYPFVQKHMTKGVLTGAIKG